MHHHPYPQHLHSYQPPMHPDMESHNHPQQQQHPYGPPPPQSRVRSHSRSNSGVYAPPPPPHGHFAAPHHEVIPPGYQGQGQGPYHPAPTVIPHPEPVGVESRHARSHSQSVSAMHYQQHYNQQAQPPLSSDYRTTPPPPPPPHVAVHDTMPHAWPGQEHSLHQRPPHHPHPYHPQSSPMLHSRTPSHSHSRAHSLSQSHPPPLQQQQQHAMMIQSPPPPRHVSPSVPVAAPRYSQDDRVDHNMRFPGPIPTPHQQQPPMQRALVVEDDEEHDTDMVRAASGPGRRVSGMPVTEEEPSDSSKCPDCGKSYKHATSLLKHRWEHSMYWKPATKFLLSKHQQVQLMEAASILLGMDESRDGDKDPIVDMFIKHRGQLATGTSTASASPPTSTKSLSASPPPMPERTLMAMKMMSPPPPSSAASYHNQHHNASRVNNMTRHSVTSTTSTASSMSSTPPSLAPDDESVVEVDEEAMMQIQSPFRQQHPHHHPYQHQPQHQPPQMVMGMEMGQKHAADPHYYPPDHRYGPAYHHQHHAPPPPPQAYAPYYHEQH